MIPTESIVVVQCDAVAQAVRQLRDTFRSSVSVKSAELIDRFWTVQDQLHRLLNVVIDDPNAFLAANAHYPRLIPDVVDVLSFTQKTTAGRLPAITYSCNAIHDLLLQWQTVKPSLVV